MTRNFFPKLDGTAVLFYVILLFMGWSNIFSASLGEDIGFIAELHKIYIRQMLYISMSVFIILFIVTVDVKFFTDLAYIWYGIAILILVGLFFFGKKISGTTAWYSIGGFGLQPSEFAKVATALAVSKYIGGGIQIDLNKRKHVLTILAIIVVPMIFIALQPDMGTVLAFCGFVLVLFTVGLNPMYLLVSFASVFVFITVLKIGVRNTVFISFFLGIIIYIANRKKRKRERRSILYTILLGFFGILLIAASTNFIYNQLFKQHHRDRFGLWLNLEKDPKKINRLNKTIGYNTHQSESAISSGGLWGKGFLQGSRTKGSFVPEQHTDYIFTTVGEEWGLAGSSLVLIVYTLFLLRLLYLTEKQKNLFSKIYGYCVVTMFFIHYAINVSMVIGLFPTVGIPLPFFSYGGSSMIAFTILLFVFLRFDAQRKENY